MSRKPTYEELEQRIKEFENAESEHNQVDKTNKDQARLLDLIFEHSLDSIVLLDKNYNFIRVSETYAKACQRDSSEFPGHNHFEFYPSNLKDDVDEAKKGKYIYRKFARPFIFPDHSERSTTYWDLGLVPILDEEGEIELFLFTLKDVTEPKRTEDELRESEARLNEAQRIAQIGSWELDLITNTLHWSDEVYRIFNLDPEKFDPVYEGFLENIHPDDREFVNNSYADSVKNKTPYDVVHRLMLKDGTLKFVNERCETFYDDAGKAVRSIGTVQDITERKQAEEELRKLSEVVKQSPMYIVVTDPEGTIEYVNPAFSEITGYSYDEALGENPRMLKTSETPPSVHKNLWDTILSGNTWKGEFCNKKKDGTKFWESATISPSKNSEGVITHFIAIKEDITERKQGEEALQAEKEFTETALAAQIDTFFVFEPATGKAIRWNKAFKDISGYSDEEIESMKAPDSYYNKEDLEKAEEIIETILQKGQGTVVMSLIDKDGRETPTEYSASIVFDKQGNPKYIISVGRDIKERIKADKEKKMMEDQLRQAQKMEAIGTLAGGIAHDFNNILSAIIGHCDLAEMKLAEDSEAIDNLNQVKNAGNRARRLIRQILAFGRMGEHERIALSLTPLIKEALKFLKSTLPTSIEIRDYIEADPGIIEADATQIHQIVMNLCTNAGHAMREEGGTLDVKLTRAEVDAQTVLQHHELHTGPHVRLTVTDTGCGMDHETLEHIFDPYFTTKEVGEGTGLGLSVVHGIVKTHNGVITVESELGKGTTFHVYFPVIEKEEKIQEEDEGPLPTGNERILFVDDEEVIVDIGEKTLGQLGYDVVTKTSSVEALELFRADPGRFDLVITDMTMPKMTGDQFARELMMVRPDIAIILCTGFSPKISKEKAKEIGIKAFAMKPLVRRDMANIVRKVLDAGQSEVQIPLKVGMKNDTKNSHILWLLSLSQKATTPIIIEALNQSSRFFGKNHGLW